MPFFRSLLLLLLLTPAAPVAAYSVLTHQSIIDSTWDRSLLPLLQQRYPGATTKQQDLARSYAYGGAIIQDMGYYPLGATIFTDLTHYVRSGDFVRNLLREAHDRNEYAFALGALAHYASDNVGHPEATNLILPQVYAKPAAKFGSVVTYEQAPVNHSQIEFCFDVVQVGAGRYRTNTYHKHIGFRVSKPLLKRAFQQTYGLEVRQLQLSFGLSVGVYRLAVNYVLPLVARADLYSKRDKIIAVSPYIRERAELYHTSSAEEQKKYAEEYDVPGFGARLLSHVLDLLPKVGPLRDYAFELPDAAGGARFHKSYRDALTYYGTLVKEQPTDTVALVAQLPNTNLDTGRPTRPTDYILTDVTYDELLRELHKHKFEHLTPALQQNIQAYFAAGPDPGAPPVRYTKATEDKQKDSRKNRKYRRQAQAAFTELQALKP
ncbi:MAG: zinc dependent phospholipase C family protein [Janthinobacterium lividum]